MLIKQRFQTLLTCADAIRPEFLLRGLDGKKLDQQAANQSTHFAMILDRPPKMYDIKAIRKLTKMQTPVSHEEALGYETKRRGNPDISHVYNTEEYMGNINEAE